MMKVGPVCLLAAVLLPAQYPPGQYPPGQYPPGGSTPLPRLPLPGRGKNKAPAKEILQEFTGKIETVEPETITITAPDTRVLTFKCSKTTKYLKGEDPIQRSVLKAGDEILIEGRTDDQGFFYAVNVKLEKPAAPQAAPAPAPKDEKESAEPKHESATTVIDHPADADDDRPVLRRGKPAPRAKKDEPEDEPQPPQVASANADITQPPAAAEPHPDDVFLEKARGVAGEFSESLPNYLCRQMTTRYQGQGRPVDWTPLDIVTAEVLYENGKESYHNIRVNNKPTNKPMEQTQGSWSRGEFGSTLRDLFAPSTAAEFHQRHESTASGRPAVMYDFTVQQPHSHWQTVLGGQSVTPAYRGSVWIDKKTFRVMRIEMQARNVPDEFPLDTIEWVVEYSYVRIGGPEFLVPVHAENLSCWRGSTQCVRNALDFRNYRKFTSESQIMTTDTNITFEGEPEKKK